MITLLLDSSGIGGIETHVATLCETLMGAGHPAEIVFLADHGPNPFQTQLRARNLSFRTLPGGLSGLRADLVQNRPALLHTHGYKAGILGRLAARLAGLPVVSTFHAGERAAFPVSLYQRLDELTATLSERIAVSRPIAERLPPGTTLIPNFVAPHALLPAPPRKPGIGFLGRLSHEKAPDRFCALAAVLAGHADFHIFGDGPMRGALEARAAGHVRFHGFITEPEQLWRHLDLLVMPSRAEGLPMAALEAIARGIPVVATDAGALADVIGHGRAGWLVANGPEGRVMDALAEAVHAWLALAPQARDAMRHGAHAHARAHFSADAALPRLLAVYTRAGYGPPA